MDNSPHSNSGMDVKEQEKAGNSADGEVEESPKSIENASIGSGWGGWGGFSAFSVLSDLQKAAEEISRNATAVAEKAARAFSENLDQENDSDTLEDEIPVTEKEGLVNNEENEEEIESKRKLALNKLEQASSDSLLGQGLKAIDQSVESLASGAWQAFGNAWKGGSSLVQKIENSAVNLAESIQHGSLPGAAPSLIETGKKFTTKGIQVLEYVGKETMDLLISETGIEVETNAKDSGYVVDEDQVLEEVTFDRCFYIYGGPEQLEELEALSNHHALLFNRRKGKLSTEQKSSYDGKLKLIQQILSLTSDNDNQLGKGKNVDAVNEGNEEVKSLHDSGVAKVADMATGFASALHGLAANDIIQKTSSRIEALHSEGVHRLSEMCCSTIAQILVLGKSLIASANKAEKVDIQANSMTLIWPEDSEEKAKVIRERVLSMSRYLEAVASNFTTGISDVSLACATALSNVASESENTFRGATTIPEKEKTSTGLLLSDSTTALGKIQDGLHYLSYVVISTSMPAV